MKGKRFLYLMLVTVFVGLTIQSCFNSEAKAEYLIETNGEEDSMTKMITWNIRGTYAEEKDSLMQHDSLLYNGIYVPKYNQVDLREVFGIAHTDTSQIMEGRITYMDCTLITEKDTTMYLLTECAMPYTILLNADTLRRKDIQGLNIFALPLKQGNNTLTVRLVSDGDLLSFESTLCDSIAIGRIFAEGQSGNIIYALVNADSKDVLLTNGHQNLLDENVIISVHDVNGHKLREFALKKDTFVYPIPEMEEGVSYMCTMTIAGTSVRQPILCGKDDDALVKFKALLDQLPENHPRRIEISETLFRLEFLLNHPSRYEGDWWWQFKIPPVTYQLEYMFAHLYEGWSAADAEPNIQFRSYISAQDDSIQRYILARPNKVCREKSMPLVVIMRPHIVNMYHLFSCPQLARQWAVNQMQGFANRYGCLIMIPEMRTYLGEDLTPKAEEELKLAIEDICKYYPVDTTQIFLHANCSGGYRALRMATDNPDMFAAIGLYAPVYHCPYSSEWSIERAPEHMLERLQNTPIFIHGDPLDSHSPYSVYKDLIEDCKKFDIPLTLSIKRNSGRAYNVVLVGREAMGFFAEHFEKN